MAADDQVDSLIVQHILPTSSAEISEFNSTLNDKHFNFNNTTTRNNNNNKDNTNSHQLVSPEVPFKPLAQRSRQQQLHVQETSLGTSSIASGNQQQANNAFDDVKQITLFGEKIVALSIDGKDRLCLAQISSTLLKEFSYNEIHNRRVALGITCVQCTPIQLEMLRRCGAMPSSSRRCGMITVREAERLCRSFLVDEQPPELPENYYFNIAHKINYGCRGRFVPARYVSSRAKCIECFYCGDYYSPNKFIFHSHKQPNVNNQHCNPPDSPNINSWRKHIDLDQAIEHEDSTKYAWEDVKSLFNGGTRRKPANDTQVHIRTSADSIVTNQLTNDSTNKCIINNNSNVGEENNYHHHDNQSSNGTNNDDDHDHDHDHDDDDDYDDDLNEVDDQTFDCQSRKKRRICNLTTDVETDNLSSNQSKKLSHQRDKHFNELYRQTKVRVGDQQHIFQSTCRPQLDMQAASQLLTANRLMMQSSRQRSSPSMLGFALNATASHRQALGQMATTSSTTPAHGLNLNSPNNMFILQDKSLVDIRNQRDNRTVDATDSEVTIHNNNITSSDLTVKHMHNNASSYNQHRNDCSSFNQIPNSNSITDDINAHNQIPISFNMSNQFNLSPQVSTSTTTSLVEPTNNSSALSVYFQLYNRLLGCQNSVYHQQQQQSHTPQSQIDLIATQAALRQQLWSDLFLRNLKAQMGNQQLSDAMIFGLSSNNLQMQSVTTTNESIQSQKQTSDKMGIAHQSQAMQALRQDCSFYLDDQAQNCSRGNNASG